MSILVLILLRGRFETIVIPALLSQLVVLNIGKTIAKLLAKERSESS